MEEKKRKIIGKMFIDIFERKVREYQEKYKIHFEFAFRPTHSIQAILILFLPVVL